MKTTFCVEFQHTCLAMLSQMALYLVLRLSQAEMIQMGFLDSWKD